METKKASKTYSPEVRARAVRMVAEHQGEHSSQWAAICSIAAKIGCSGETLRGWVRRAERDEGRRDGATTETRDRLKALKGVVRGKAVKTTVSDRSAPCPLDRVNREFQAPRPNALWVSDFTYVATWSDFVYVAFVIDAYARRIVGWRVSPSAEASFVLDALEQAIHARRPTEGDGLIHHSDRGSQYLSIRYTERLGEAGIAPSVGSVGDSYDCEYGLAA